MRWREVLFERFAMSRVGYLVGSRLGPPIDKFLLPRTNGRLGTMGIDKVGLVMTTGAKSGQQRTHPLALIDDPSKPLEAFPAFWAPFVVVGEGGAVKGR